MQVGNRGAAAAVALVLVEQEVLLQAVALCLTGAGAAAGGCSGTGGAIAGGCSGTGGAIAGLFKPVLLLRKNLGVFHISDFLRNKAPAPPTSKTIHLQGS